MSNENDGNSMDPAVFEQFLREIHSRLNEFEVDKEKTTEFFNEAVRQVNERLGSGDHLDYFKMPQADLDDE